MMIAPVLVCVTLLALQALSNLALDRQLPQGSNFRDIGPVPPCHKHGNIDCVSVMYAPVDVPWLNIAMKEVAKRNSLKFGADIVPLPNGTTGGENPFLAPERIIADNETMINHFVEQRNATQLGLFVHTAYLPLSVNDSKVPDQVGYIVYANDSRSNLDWLALPLQRSLEEVLISLRTNKNVSIEVTYKNSPRGALRVEGFDVVNAQGAQWFYIPPMIAFIMLLVEITTEKEKKLRIGMQMMGLSASAYWIVWVLTAIVLSILISGLLIGTGYLCKFAFFTKTSLAVTSLLFFLFTMSLSTMAMFCSTLIKKSATAQTVGYAIILVGFIFQGILASAYGLLVDMLYYEGAKPWVAFLRWALTIYPPFNMAQAFGDISAKSGATPDITKGAIVAGPGFTWDDLFTSRKLPHIFGLTIDVPQPIVSFILLAANAVFFLVLALMIDSFFPNDGRASSFSVSAMLQKRRDRYRLHQLRKNGVYYDDNDADENEPLLVSDQRMSLNADDNDRAEEPLLDESNAAADESVARERRVVERKLATSVDGVYVNNLYKRYGGNSCRSKGVDAVQGVSLAFETNTITAILGPNGAGKTTLMSIMLGLVRKTRGDVAFFGGEVDALRHRVGVCPQHDLLFDKLTAREHLKLYARLKRVRRNVRQQCDALLTQVDLLGVADQCVDTFSGGMKRRLSMAIACIGNPLILVLDECTTGMDPVHRASVWRIIERVKRDRVVVLTTHSMLEAEALGDRVAIMAGGKVQVIGSPISLKNRYGSGWTISIGGHGAASPELLRTLRSAAPSAAIDSAESDESDVETPASGRASASLSDLGLRQSTSMSDLAAAASVVAAATSVHVPRDAENELLAAVEVLEASEEVDFVVRQSTLEDVFNNVTARAGFRYDEIGPVEDDDDAQRAFDGDKELRPAPYRANFLKNLTLQWRQWGTNLCQIFTPVLMILTIVLLESVIKSQLGTSDLSFSATLPAFFFPLNTPISEFTNVPGFKNELPWFGVYSNDNDCARFFIFADETEDGLAGELYMDGSSSKSGLLPKIKQRDCAMYGLPEPLDACGFDRKSNLNNVHFQVPWFRELPDATSLDRCVYETTKHLNNVELRHVDRIPEMYLLPDGMISFEAIDWKSDNPRLRFSFAINDHPILQYHRKNNFTRLDVEKRHEDAFSQILAKNERIEDFGRMALMDLVLSSFVRKVDSSYLPASGQLPQLNTKFAGRMPRREKENIIGLLHAFGVFLYPIALSLPLPIYIYVLVLERAARLRAHMFAHGMRLLPYYATTFAFNLLLYALTIAALWVSGAWAGIEFFALTSPLLLLVFFAGWGLLLVAFAFLLSTALASPRAASVLGYVIALFGSLIGVVVSAGIYGDIPLLGLDRALPWFWLLVPQCAMARAVYLMCHRCDHEHECYAGLPPPDDELARVLLALFALAALCLALGLAADSGFRLGGQLRVRLRTWWARRRARGDAASERDAALERSALIYAEAEAGEAESADEDADGDEQGRGRRRRAGRAVLDVERLSKKYPGAKQFAVKRLSFAISEGKVFALTGANGAGKTTLLSMLTGNLLPSSGDARVCGYSITKELKKVQQNIGVCTQFDILWDSLTCEETLLFYARLKGVARSKERAHVAQLLRELGLYDARDRTPSQLSGGMRRRLSLGVSLSGGSRFVLLDEPTTGLDPVSRANIWRIVERAKGRKRSILLTTHAFEEAERLADTVAIMHHGRLRALGTVAQLASSAGSHYMLRVTFSPEQREEVAQDVLKVTPHAEQVRLFDSMGTWRIAKRDDSGQQWRFSKLFRALKANERVHDFSLTDVGLTEVFESIVLSK